MSIEWNESILEIQNFKMYVLLRMLICIMACDFSKCPVNVGDPGIFMLRIQTCSTGVYTMYSRSCWIEVGNVRYFDFFCLAGISNFSG
jgi:hypothetical protein